MNRTKEGVEVQVGQIWQDLDSRMRGRKRKVVAILGERVLMDEPTASLLNKVNPTRVSIRRMHRHSTGWALIDKA
jgi:hypothetical protein